MQNTGTVTSKYGAGTVTHARTHLTRAYHPHCSPVTVSNLLLPVENSSTSEALSLSRPPQQLEGPQHPSQDDDRDLGPPLTKARRPSSVRKNKHLTHTIVTVHACVISHGRIRRTQLACPAAFPAPAAAPEALDVQTLHRGSGRGPGKVRRDEDQD